MWTRHTRTGGRVMTSTVVRPPANFWDDLEDERTKDAERLVWAYLQRTNRWPCEDTRDLHVPWDFRVMVAPGLWKQLDVKADRWMDESGRLPYETHHVYPDGSEKDGWGRSTALDIVAVVAMGKDGVPGTHRCVFVERKAMHQLVEGAITTAERERRSMPANWVPFERENEGGKVTHGWAVPMGEAFKAMVYRTVVQLPGGRR